MDVSQAKVEDLEPWARKLGFGVAFLVALLTGLRKLVRIPKAAHGDQLASIKSKLATLEELESRMAEWEGKLTSIARSLHTLEQRYTQLEQRVEVGEIRQEDLARQIYQDVDNVQSSIARMLKRLKDLTTSGTQ